MIKLQEGIFQTNYLKAPVLQVPYWRKQGKQIGERSDPREVVWGGETAAPFPPPQAAAYLASFADIFPF